MDIPICSSRARVKWAAHSAESFDEKILAPTFAVIGVLAVTSSVCAQDNYEKFNDPFRVYIGGFWPTIDSKIGTNGDILPPKPPVDVENALGIENSQGVAWGGAGWHFEKCHSVEFEFFALKRDGGISGAVSPPIGVGDNLC